MLLRPSSAAAAACAVMLVVGGAVAQTNETTTRITEIPTSIETTTTSTKAPATNTTAPPRTTTAPTTTAAPPAPPRPDDNKDDRFGIESTFKFSEPALIASMNSVDYHWDGSPWPDKDVAIASGAFVVDNNIITGINHNENYTFITVPRWKVGVPSTLNTLAFEHPNNDPTEPIRPILRPWPDWGTNINKFKYVQSVFVDHHAGEVWIIDTGRQYFFSSPEQTVNRAAGLYIYNIATAKEMKNFTFPADIFSFTDSFLNDIVVDTERQVAYMTDTNIAGKGAVIAYRRLDDAVIRFEDPSSTYSNSSFVIDVDGTKYPNMTSPADGITLSADAARLFYSAVEGNTVYCLNTSYLRKALDSANTFVPSTLFDKVEKAFFRNTASDGLALLPTAEYSQVAYGMFTSPTGVGSFSDSNFADGNGAAVNYTRVAASQPWVDTFAVVPWFGMKQICENMGFGSDLCTEGQLPIASIPTPQSNCPADDTVQGTTNCPNLYGYGGSMYGFSLYFTANNLQKFFAGTMDFHNRSITNMFVYRVDYYYQPNEAPYRPATEMKMALAFLGSIACLSFVTLVILVAARVMRSREAELIANGGEGDANYRKYSESRRNFGQQQVRR